MDTTCAMLDLESDTPTEGHVTSGQCPDDEDEDDEPEVTSSTRLIADDADQGGRQQVRRRGVGDPSLAPGHVAPSLRADETRDAAAEPCCCCCCCQGGRRSSL